MNTHPSEAKDFVISGQGVKKIAVLGYVSRMRERD
jgi:hypothetical protein